MHLNFMFYSKSLAELERISKAINNFLETAGTLNNTYIVDETYIEDEEKNDSQIKEMTAV